LGKSYQIFRACQRVFSAIFQPHKNILVVADQLVKIFVAKFAPVIRADFASLKLPELGRVLFSEVVVVFHGEKLADFFAPVNELFLKIVLVFIFCSAGPDPISQAASPIAPCSAFFDWHSLG
jgi:hypothetical protein